MLGCTQLDRLLPAASCPATFSAPPPQRGEYRPGSYRATLVGVVPAAAAITARVLYIHLPPAFVLLAVALAWRSGCLETVGGQFVPALFSLLSFAAFLFPFAASLRALLASSAMYLHLRLRAGRYTRVFSTGGSARCTVGFSQYWFFRNHYWLERAVWLAFFVLRRLAAFPIGFRLDRGGARSASGTCSSGTTTCFLSKPISVRGCSFAASLRFLLASARIAAARACSTFPPCLLRLLSGVGGGAGFAVAAYAGIG